MANEKRLIDANALIAEYDRVHIGEPGGARKLMEDAPTVQAVEVVHGRWKKGAIISGYQGIGKSTLAKRGSGYIDLESGNFFVNGERSPDWYIAYSQIAIHLAEQGYRVFISSHAVVREYLASLPKTVDLFACFPAYSLKAAWTQKLENRFRSSCLDKDYRAWQNAVARYDENIKELHETKGFAPIVIHDMNYSLERLLDTSCGAKMEVCNERKAD